MSQRGQPLARAGLTPGYLSKEDDNFNWIGAIWSKFYASRKRDWAGGRPALVF